MRNVKILAALGLMTMAGVAQADVSGTATIVTDYDFRGVTQTGNGTALQLSLDYATEGGWYVGTWGSNIGPFVNWDGTGSAPTEMDVYTGFKGATEGGLGWDAGVVYYAYPGASDLDYAEIYGKLSYSIVSGGVYYSDDFGGTDGQDSFTGLPGGDAYYVYGDLGIPAGPVIIGLHAGLSSGDGVQATYASGLFAGSTEDSYVDYAVGITYPVSGFNLGFKWISTDAGDGQGDDDRIILTLGTAFPWAK